MIRRVLVVAGCALLLAACDLPLPGTGAQATTAPPSDTAQTPTGAAQPTSAPMVASGTTATSEGAPAVETQAATQEPTSSEPTDTPILQSVTSAEAGSVVQVGQIDAPGVTAIAVSPLSDMLAAAQGNTIMLYSLPFRDPTADVKLEGHTARITALSWSPDGTQLASTSDDGTLRLWDTTSGDQVSKFDIGGVSTAAWSPDGLIIAAGDHAATVHLLDGTSGDETLTIPAADSGTVTAITWSPDGTQFATATIQGDAPPGDVKLWDAETGEGQRKPVSDYYAPGPTGIAWSPAEDIVAWVSSSDNGQTHLWTVGGDKNAIVLGGQSKVTSISWSADGNMLATAGADRAIKLWNSADGSALATLTGSTDAVQTVMWSPDGTYLVSAGLDNVIRIWGFPAG